MMDRYWVQHDLTAPGTRIWYVDDRQQRRLDRSNPVSEGYVAACLDPEVAQRIADWLNREEFLTEALISGAAFRKVARP
jgi:hypothetical protein